MAAQIRKDQPVARNQRVRDRAPELVIGRKWMKQNDRGAGAEEFITDFRVAAGDPFHALGLTTALYVVVTCWPAGAVSAVGCFGITILATMYAYRPTLGDLRATTSH